MKRILWTGQERLEIEDSPPPIPRRPDDVLLHVSVAGICSTDVHIIQGAVRIGAPPRVLGHEIAGVVEACGRDVQRLRPGDRVTCDSVIGCGVCEWCARGAVQFCPSGGELGMTCDGGWAELLVVPERNLHRLPDSIPDDVAAILDIEVFGALRKPGIRAGETVAIFGPGPAGLIAGQIARAMGAGSLILCGTRPDRLALGRTLGIDHTIDVTCQDPVAAIRDLTGGLGADLSFDAAGTPSATAAAIHCLRPQGRAILYGIHGRTIPCFPIDQIVLKDLELYGALSDRTGWAEVIELVATGRLRLQPLISHTFPLDQAQAAYTQAAARTPGTMKVVLRPQA